MAYIPTLYDYEVPELKFLNKIGIVEKVKNMYLSKKQQYIKRYPILLKQEEEMVPIYIVYFSMYNYLIDNEGADPEKYAHTLIDDKELSKAYNNALPKLVEFLEDLDMEAEDYEGKYKEYQKQMRDKLSIKPKIVFFMKTMYDEKIRRAVYNNSLSNFTLSFEKVGIDLSSKENLDLSEYLFYLVLYQSYVHMTGNNPIKKIEFRRTFKKVPMDTLNELARIYLSSIEDDLLTFEEWVMLITYRQLSMIEVINISKIQLEEFNSSQRVRNE